MNEWGISDEAAALHADALVWDGCISWISMEMMRASYDLKISVMPRYARAGCNHVSLTVSGDFGADLEKTIHWIAAERKFFKTAHAEQCILVDTTGDIRRAKDEGKVAVSFHFQGANPFAGNVNEDPGDTNLVQLYYDLGVRQSLLAHNLRNMVADGCKEPGDAGLSFFGVRLIEEMNRVGMVVDCTHTGYRSTMEAMEVSEKPVVFSHSNAKAIFNHPRNIADDQIKACAKGGGVVGVTGWGPIVNERNEATAEELVKHMDHIAALVGPEHLAFGLDYVYDAALTTQRVQAHPHLYAPGTTMKAYNYDMELMDFMQPEALPLLTQTLLQRGYSETEVRGILGENLLRVASQVWAA